MSVSQQEMTNSAAVIGLTIPRLACLLFDTLVLSAASSYAWRLAPKSFKNRSNTLQFAAICSAMLNMLFAIPRYLVIWIESEFNEAADIALGFIVLLFSTLAGILINLASIERYIRIIEISSNGNNNNERLLARLNVVKAVTYLLGVNTLIANTICESQIISNAQVSYMYGAISGTLFLVFASVVDLGN